MHVPASTAGGTIPLPGSCTYRARGHLTAPSGSTWVPPRSAWYQDYYGTPYPTDKCDMIALPDFAAGAMENVGCITYREDVLLVDPVTSTQIGMQTVADVISHELADMWFGDLVTMKWWNGIWLNEAFATFMEVACCDAYRPRWKRWATFSLERSRRVDIDTFASPAPAEFPVLAPADCEGMFDVLTYQKGGALCLCSSSTSAKIISAQGVNYYLRHPHLWQHRHLRPVGCDRVAPTRRCPVRRIMDSWIWQGGYPLVSVQASTGLRGRCCS
ncbi:MAG: M1 family aminopeptidase [Albidovulum sp.]